MKNGTRSQINKQKYKRLFLEKFSKSLEEINEECGASANKTTILINPSMFGNI